MKKHNSIGRVTLSVLFLLIQIVWIIILIDWLNHYSAVIGMIMSGIALILAIIIFNRQKTPPEFKTPLIMLIIAFPFVGLGLLIGLNRKTTTRKMKHRFSEFQYARKNGIMQDREIINELENDDCHIANQFRYLSEKEGYPVYHDSKISFYAEADEAYRRMIEAVNSAEKFIFLEYHAFEDSVSFQTLYLALKRKAEQGLDVRIIYDDIGSAGFLDGQFKKKMEASGIKCKDFNPVMPAIRLFMNNRDHRKIAVIDGRKAFTGGYNIADEYFGVTHPYGKWKDTGVEITGNTVSALTEMFLSMWNSTEKEPELFSDFYRFDNQKSENAAFIQPYADNPLDDRFVGENVYLNMIKGAAETLYVTTPYLILSNSIQRELQMAAERGVDVRIVTPGIPDKKLIYHITRSYYEPLTRSGVRIYEYTPGFLHAKQMTADHKLAIVGTINLDFRSFYHHFENAVLMYKTDAVREIDRDFENLFKVSREVTEEHCLKRNKRFLVLDSLLRLIAPLL